MTEPTVEQRLAGEIEAQTGYRPFQDGDQRQLLTDALALIREQAKEIERLRAGLKGETFPTSPMGQHRRGEPYRSGK